MNMLYEEGLILENSFSISQDELRAIGDDPDGPMIAVVAAFGADGAVQKGTARWAEYFFLMPPLEGPNGDKWAPNKDPWNIFYPGMMVTDRCSDPNLAVALYNYMIDFEVSMDGYIGPKGEAWDDPDSDGVSLRGDEAKYKLLVNYGTQRVNSSWNQYNPMMRNSTSVWVNRHRTMKPLWNGWKLEIPTCWSRCTPTPPLTRSPIITRLFR